MVTMVGIPFMSIIKFLAPISGRFGRFGFAPLLPVLIGVGCPFGPWGGGAGARPSARRGAPCSRLWLGFALEGLGRRSAVASVSSI